MDPSRTTPTGEDSPSSRQAAALLRAADVALAASLFVTPLLLGGRHDVGRLFYVAAASIAAVCLLIHAGMTRIRSRLPKWPLLLFSAAIGLVVLQLVPLPAGVVAALGPDLTETLPLWGVDAPFGGWQTLSLTPGATRQGLFLLIGHALLLTAWLLRLRGRQDIERVMQWLVAAAVGMMVIGFVQFARGEEALLGFYRHPQRDFGHSLQGTFTNRNHFAHFLILGLGPACWLAAAARCGDKASKSKASPPGLVAVFGSSRLKIVALTTLLLIAIVSAQSRGAVAVLAVVLALLGVMFYRAGLLRLPQVLAGAASAVALLTVVSLYEGDRVSRRIDDLVTGDVEQLDSTHARRSVWGANLAALRSSPLVGYGAGSHPDVYPLFIDRAYAQEFTHAESSYFQIASENGGAGLLLVLLAILGVGATSVRGIRRSTDATTTVLWAAVAAGLVASVTHSVFDFVWYLPGLMAATLALVACAIRLERLDRPEALAHGENDRSAGWQAPLGFATAAAALAVTLALGPALSSGDWDRFLRRSVGIRGIAARLAAAETAEPDSRLIETMERTVAESVDLLDAVTRRDPYNARAHQRLAARLLQLYELRAAHAPNGMSVDLLRDAAVHGGFANHTQRLAWLDRAVGEGVDLLRRAHHHAGIAVRLGPLQGKAYLHLATLSFLEAKPIETDRLVAQAVVVSPLNGAVLFEAGRQLWIDRRLEAGFELWRRGLNLAGSHVPELVSTIARIFPAQVFVEELQPGLRALDIALKQYRIHGEEEDLLVLCQHVTAEATRAEEAGGEPSLALAYRWRQVSQTLRSLQRAEEAVPHAEHATGLEPHSLPMRLELATALYQAERFEEADPHLRWCLARRPDLRYLHEWLQEGARRRTAVDQNRRSRGRLYATLAAREAEPPTSEKPVDLPVKR